MKSVSPGKLLCFLLLSCIMLLLTGSFKSNSENAPLTIVAFGNSTTADRNGIEKVYARRLEELLSERHINATILNAGIPGNTTEDARRRFKTEVIEKEPDIVIIQFGLNDAAVDVHLGKSKPRVSKERYRENLLYFINILQSEEIKVILMTPNPVRWTENLKSVFGKPPYDINNPKGFNLLSREYAQSVRVIAANTGTPLIDVYSHFEYLEAAEDITVSELLLDGLHPNDRGHEIIAGLLTEKISGIVHDMRVKEGEYHGFTIPLIDLAENKEMQIIVDREKGQYLGHPTTVLLEDGKTIITVYPKGHGRGGIVMKRSMDGGKTWSDRLPVPENWATSKEVPTIHRVVDPAGVKRLIMFSGLYPTRIAVSEDDGYTWTPLKPVGDWGGIVVMGCVVELKTGKGHYMAMFHDDGRFFTKDGRRVPVMTLYKTFSYDGGLTWSYPEEIYKDDRVHLCEPGVIRSPDGKQLAALLRENRRVRNSHVIFSNDEGKTWTAPRELPGSLNGDRHTGKYAPDGRLFISFRDITPDRGSPTEGDWVGWLGTYDDIVNGREGQYRIRLMDNHSSWDCAYPGVEVLPDGTFVTTTYGHWVKGESPFIVSVRFKIPEIDEMAGKSKNR
ncbi:GDSL-type esterase/lipase family protein [candidate division KSB1 bacterium]